MAQPTPGTTTSSSTSSVSTLTFACTVSTGQTVLIVDVGMGSTGAARHAASVTFNGVAMTLLWGPVTDTNWDSCEQWYLLNPDVGTFNVVITVDAGSFAQIGAGATPYSGVDISSGATSAFGTPATAANAGTTAASTGSITSNADSIVIGTCFTDGAANCEPDGTKLWEINNIATDTAGSGQYKTSAPATLNWTCDEVGWACGGVSLHGTSSGGGGTLSRARFLPTNGAA